MIKLKLTVLICLIGFSSFAQKTEDVIYLKNGWIIRGSITQKTDTQVTITSSDRNVFVLRSDEILKISREMLPAEYNLKQRGFSHFVELGPLASQNTGELNVNTSAFSFQALSGYKFNQYAFLGAGAGVDLYATQTFFPVFATFRGDLLSKKQFVPFYFTDFGYGINGTNNASPGISYKGGTIFAAGLGLKIGLSKNAGVMISLGYRNQRYGSVRNGQDVDDNYNRIALRAGFYL